MVEFNPVILFSFVLYVPFPPLLSFALMELGFFCWFFVFYFLREIAEAEDGGWEEPERERERI